MFDVDGGLGHGRRVVNSPHDVLHWRQGADGAQRVLVVTMTRMSSQPQGSVTRAFAAVMEENR